MEELQEQIAALKAELASKTQDGETLLATNAELQAQLVESEKTVEEVKVIVKDGKQRYEVITPRVQVAGKTYVAADLKKLPEVVKALVEKRSGILKAL